MACNNCLAKENYYETIYCHRVSVVSLSRRRGIGSSATNAETTRGVSRVEGIKLPRAGDHGMGQKQHCESQCIGSP